MDTKPTDCAGGWDIPLPVLQFIRTIPGYEGISEQAAINIVRIAEKLARQLQLPNSLTLDEGRLLEVLRTGNYERIAIDFREGKIKTITLTEALDEKQRIVDVLKANSFQEVTIKTHRGKVTRMVRTTKIHIE